MSFTNENRRVKLFNTGNVYSKNVEKFIKMIEEIRSDGSGKVHFIADFDWTMSKFIANGKRTQLSYDVFLESEFIPCEIKAKYENLKKTYLPIYLNYNCDEVEKKKKMLEWWDYMHSLIVEAKITLSSLKASVRTANIETRDNIDEFIHTLNELKIPLLILSGGFGNVVIELLKDNNILFDNVKVLSNIVEFDENEIGVNFISDTIHMYNKNEAVLYDKEYLLKVKDRHNVFVIGDAEGDHKMAQSLANVKNVCKIGFLNSYNESTLEAYMNLFDIVIVEDSSFDIMNEILKFIFNK